MHYFEIYDLKTNYLTNPIGMDSIPRLTWKIKTDIRGFIQQSFRVIVANHASDLKNENLVWDSGRINSDDNFIICDTELRPISCYFWQVIIWDNEGNGVCSDIATFETGKMKEEWQGNFITAEYIKKSKKESTVHIAPYIRKQFSIQKTMEKARLFVCGLGYCDTYINGQKAGTDVLSPAFTKYDMVVEYVEYDVTQLLNVGENVLGFILGTGWYSFFSDDEWNTKTASWIHVPKVLAELHIFYSDGTNEVLATNTSFKGMPGPIIFNGIRNGEQYDARKEIIGWNTSEVDDAEWPLCKITRTPGGVLVSREMEPITIHKPISAIKKWQVFRPETTVSGVTLPAEDVWIFDFGQNMAGVAQISVLGKKGTTVTLRYSDTLYDDGRLNQLCISGFVRSNGFQMDKYIKKGDERETWHAKFVYHGFQYVEISGLPYEPDLSDVKALPIYNDYSQSGFFRCSNSLLNRVQHLCTESTVSNSQSVLTDCPHREKNSWIGDVSFSSEQFLMNYHAVPFLNKWMRDCRQSQTPAGSIPAIIPSTGWGYNGINGPDWSSALINVPWNLYIYSGDKRILVENYDAMKKLCYYIYSMSSDYIVNYGIGDWCAPFEGQAISANMGSFKCPVAVTDTAFFFNAANKISKIAKILGKEKESIQYGMLAQKIKKAFRNKFWNKQTGIVEGNCQTATACMLYFELCETDEIPMLTETLLRQIHANKDHLDYGVLGLKFVMESLGETGNNMVGVKMLCQKTFPSCQRWIDLGASTLWECWNGLGSRNHHMFSDLSTFLYKYVGGISPDRSGSGFKHIEFRPAVMSELQYAEAQHESNLGTVILNWYKNKNELSISISIPVGADAKLYLPKKYKERLCEGDKLIKETFPIYETEKEFCVLLKSGKYEIGYGEKI